MHPQIKDALIAQSAKHIVSEFFEDDNPFGAFIKEVLVKEFATRGIEFLPEGEKHLASKFLDYFIPIMILTVVPHVELRQEEVKELDAASIEDLPEDDQEAIKAMVAAGGATHKMASCSVHVELDKLREAVANCIIPAVDKYLKLETPPAFVNPSLN